MAGHRVQANPGKSCLRAGLCISLRGHPDCQARGDTGLLLDSCFPDSGTCAAVRNAYTSTTDDKVSGDSTIRWPLRIRSPCRGRPSCSEQGHSSFFSDSILPLTRCDWDEISSRPLTSAPSAPPCPRLWERPKISVFYSWKPDTTKRKSYLARLRKAFSQKRFRFVVFRRPHSLSFAHQKTQKPGQPW